MSDLVPKSYLAIGLLFLAGLTSIAGLAAAQLYLRELAEWGTKDGVAAFELGGRGSLASWLGSLWLALAGLGSLLIYSIRRHKLDDYRGHYRWWLVAGIAWLVMSIDAITGLHDLFRAAMTRFTGYSAPASGHAWWIGCWGLLLAATVVRLLLDMRACRIALVTIALALAAWSAGLAVQLSGASLRSIPTALVAETLKLSGHLLLLLGVTLVCAACDSARARPAPFARSKTPQGASQGKGESAASGDSSLNTGSIRHTICSARATSDPISRPIPERPPRRTLISPRNRQTPTTTRTTTTMTTPTTAIGNSARPNANACGSKSPKNAAGEVAGVRARRGSARRAHSRIVKEPDREAVIIPRGLAQFRLPRRETMTPSPFELRTEAKEGIARHRK